MSDRCTEDKSGGCAADSCLSDKSGACTSDVCTVSDKSGECSSDTCNEDNSGQCKNDTCKEDNSSQCINDTCDIDNRICESDATCPFDGTCFMDGFCPVDEDCLVDGFCPADFTLDSVSGRRKPQTGGNSLANAALKWLYRLVALLLFLPFLTLPHIAEAAVYNIAAGDVAGLIAAMEAANADPDADTINLATGDYVLTEPYPLDDDEYDPLWISGLPSVISPITINGSESGATTVLRSATAVEGFSVFHVTTTDVEVSEGSWEEWVGNLTLNRLVIRGGLSSAGAGVFNQGATLTITYCTLRENVASGGGAIGNLGGTLTVTHSTISGNTANGYGYEPAAGGGIENIGGQVTVRNSTIHGNSVQSEDGVAAGGGMSGPAQEILNVTISGNQAAATGGEVEAIAIGGGLFSPAGLKNSIVTQNTADVGLDVFATASQGYNIIKTSTATSFFVTGTSDLVNTDPGLGSYTDSGAPGKGYLPVLAGSPAIDSADAASCSSEDQLGYPRINTCERGAIEYRAGPHIWPTSETVPFGNVNQESSSDRDLTVQNIGTDNLIIGTIGLANPLSPPFSITTDNCSGQTLAAGHTCTLTVRFAPAATGAFNDSFDIPSNDPDENPVTVAVSGTGAAQTYTVTYNGNGNTGGTVPVDPNSPYASGATVTVLGNTGNLVRTGYGFAGWNTAADGSGTSYTAGSHFTMPAANLILYARWTLNAYTLTTTANPAQGGTVVRNPNQGTYDHGAVVQLTATANAGYAFREWSGDLTGTDNPASVTMDGNKTITAEFATGYTVTYDGNGNTGGTAPVDTNSPYAAGATVTVLENTGNLVKTEYSFNGWNTAEDGSGTSYPAGSQFTMPAANVILYAKWKDYEPIPTLSEWGAIIFITLLAGVGLWGVGRRNRRTWGRL